VVLFRVLSPTNLACSPHHFRSNSRPFNLLQPLCFFQKSQLLSNQQNPASFCKTPGVGCTSTQLPFGINNFQPLFLFPVTSCCNWVFHPCIPVYLSARRLPRPGWGASVAKLRGAGGGGLDFQLAVENFQGPITALAPRVRWMPSGHARQMLWRPEFNGDVLLSLDRPSVQESGLVTPQANGAHCGRKKRDRAAHVLYIQHLAELSDGGADLYGFR